MNGSRRGYTYVVRFPTRALWLNSIAAFVFNFGLNRQCSLSSSSCPSFLAYLPFSGACII